MTRRDLTLTKAQIRGIFQHVAARYELLGTKPIGEPSGFGAVWKAHDLWLGREVALKFSDSDMADELRLCRDIEGQTVRVFDYFRAESGWNAYAMELLDFPWISISGFIRKHKYRSGDLQHYFDCFEIARSLLSGLSQIHGRPYSREGGFVHADIKPDNLFLLVKPKKRPDTVFRLSSSDSLVKILDMGISTRNGSVLSGYTPAYSSGKKVARPGVDLYAAAVTFLELLTGERPCRTTMGHKARIRAFIRQMPSGSAYIDELAADFARNCATAYSRSGETVRVHLRHLEENVFSISGFELTVLRAISKRFPNGAKKEELAEYLFAIAASSRGWRNRTEQRVEWIKDIITGLYRKRMVILRGQRYFPA